MAANVIFQGVVGVALLFIVATCTLIFGIHYERSTSTSYCHIHPQNAHQKPMWDFSHVPNPPPVFTPKIFLPISDSASFGSLEAATKDKSWDSLLTPGGGFIQTKNEMGEEVGFGVSMFHELHCLIMIRSMLLGMPMGREHEAGDWREDNMHWLHCLDYLAQGILCSADDTLERPGFTKNFKGELVEGIDGMNHTHQCRDSSKLWDAVLDSERTPRPQRSMGQTTVFPIPGRDSEGAAWVVSEN